MRGLPIWEWECGQLALDFPVPRRFKSVLHWKRAMSLEQTIAQIFGPMAMVAQLEPQLLLALFVAFLFLILLVIGGFTAWSRARRLQRRGQERADEEWKAELLRRITEPDEKSSSSE